MHSPAVGRCRRPSRRGRLAKPLFAGVQRVVASVLPHVPELPRFSQDLLGLRHAEELGDRRPVGGAHGATIAEPMPGGGRGDLERPGQFRHAEPLFVVAVLQPEPQEFAGVVHVGRD